MFQSTNTIDRHDITEILLKVALNTITSNTFLLKVRYQFGDSHKKLMYSILARVKSLFIDWKTGQWFSPGDRVTVSKIIILIVDVSVLLEVVIVLIMISINDLQCKLIVRC